VEKALCVTGLTQFLFSGHFEFTWQQFMIGVQSSLIMFPVNILIVSIFRNTNLRETSCCQRKTKKTNALQKESTSQTVTPKMAIKSDKNVNATVDTIFEAGAFYFCAK